jgi:hypothetical protein
VIFLDFGEILLDLLFSARTSQISISGLSKKLKEEGFSGDYKNTYQKIMSFEKEGFVLIKKIGKSKAISINYQNPKTISKLAIMELSKKIDFIEKNMSFEKILFELTRIKSNFILMSNPQKNLALNRLELLAISEEPIDILRKCDQIQKKYSLRIDCLALKNNDFAKLIKSNNITINEILINKIILNNQEKFFQTLGEMIFENDLSKTKYSLIDLNESEIRFNLSKFGYSEFGKEQKNKEIGFEETIIVTIIKGTARQRKALIQLITKNDFNPELLAFLAKKYSKQNEIKKLINHHKNNSKLIELEKLMKWMGAISW